MQIVSCSETEVKRFRTVLNKNMKHFIHTQPVADLKFHLNSVKLVTLMHTKLYPQTRLYRTEQNYSQRV
jgi:hypothetical protein